MTRAATTSAGRRASNNNNANDANSVASAALAEAIAHEQSIADEATAIWSKDEWADSDMNRWLYAELRPLLRRQIPKGFIEHVGKVEGKPYESTGVKSVQVQMDRLDNVLGADAWGYEATYSEGGKLCHVRAWIGAKDAPLIERDSYGGVARGSSLGNVYKGSFTNAAKLAFARLGPGWEVYVGAADFDPDTDKDAAEAQAKEKAGESEQTRKLPPEKIATLAEAIDKAGLSEHLGTKLRGFGISSLDDATVEQGISLWEWAQGG